MNLDNKDGRIRILNNADNFKDNNEVNQDKLGLSEIRPFHERLKEYISA